MGAHTGITKIMPMSDYQSLWKRKNPEKVKEYRKKYYSQNKEKFKEWDKQQYHKKHPNSTPREFSRINLVLEMLKKHNLTNQQIEAVFEISPEQRRKIIVTLTKRHKIIYTNEKYYLVEANPS